MHAEARAIEVAGVVEGKGRKEKKGAAVRISNGSGGGGVITLTFLF